MIKLLSILAKIFWDIFALDFWPNSFLCQKKRQIIFRFFLEFKFYNLKDLKIMKLLRRNWSWIKKIVVIIQEKVLEIQFCLLFAGNILTWRADIFKSIGNRNFKTMKMSWKNDTFKVAKLITELFHKREKNFDFFSSKIICLFYDNLSKNLS